MGAMQLGLPQSQAARSPWRLLGCLCAAVRTDLFLAVFRPTVAVRVMLLGLILPACNPAGSYSSSYQYAGTPGRAAHDVRGQHGEVPDDQALCVRYSTKAGWSHPYRVRATVISGGDLNQRTESYRFEPYATYVVIFWDAGQASIIKLSHFFGELSFLATPGVDLQGRPWTVAKTDYCW